MDLKEQHSPDRHSNLTKATVLTEEASQAACVVSFDKSQCTHTCHVTHTKPVCSEKWAMVSGLQHFSAMVSPHKSEFLT